MKQNAFELLNGKDLHIAIVASRFNTTLTDALVADCLESLTKCQVPEHQIKTVRVPGSYELPIMAAELIQQEQYDAVVCLGVIIKGETTHDHYIATAVSNSLNDLAVTSRVPMIFGVLTTDNLEQAEARCLGGAKKGWEAGMSAVEMGLLMKAVRKHSSSEKNEAQQS